MKQGLHPKSSLGLSIIVSLMALLWTNAASAASLVVNSLNDQDDGVCDTSHCSLREAINFANANPGADTISFDLSGPGPFTIMPASPLPALSDGGTTIDGTTQPGYAGAPLIMLQPGYPTTQALPLTGGITLASSGNTVRGLSITGFDMMDVGYTCGSAQTGGGGIVVRSGTGNLIEGNYLGLSPSGSSQGNQVGIYIHPDAPGQTISHNVISGNQCGIATWGDSQTILANRIGTDPSGTTAIGNAAFGIYIASSFNQIGAAGAGNLISGQSDNFSSSGIGLTTPNGVSNRNFILGNKIGTDISGTAAIPNSRGIFQITGEDTIIGGFGPGEGNIVAFNLGSGIHVVGVNHYVLQNEIFNNGNFGVEAGPQIRRNSIYDNGFLGISAPLGAPAPVAINPMANGASISGQSVEPCMFCLVEVFIADPDPSGGGEGREYLGITEIDFNGDFYLELPLGLQACDRLTATITNHSNQTSAFSQNVVVQPCLQLDKPGLLVLVLSFPVFIGPLLGGLIGRRRGQRSFRRGALFGGVGGLVVVAGLWMMPFVEIMLLGSPMHPPDPISPGGESKILGFDFPPELSPTVEREQDDATPTPTPTQTQLPSPTATPTSMEELGLCTFEAVVNIFCRSGQDTHFEAIDSFTPGQMAPVVGMSADGFYWYVLGPLSGKMCTVPSTERYGFVSGACSTLPEFTPMPTPVDTPTLTPTATATLSRGG